VVTRFSTNGLTLSGGTAPGSSAQLAGASIKNSNTNNWRMNRSWSGMGKA
jgi:hypothetical protein